MLESRAETGQVYRTLYHGQINHGLQFVDPKLRKIPTTYFAESTGLGGTFEFIPQRFEHRNEPMHVGVVGLGIGTIATYALPGDRFRFYEINQQVLDLAKSHFTYLEDCRGEVDVILGDGRISLERELSEGRGNNFDILIIDAFSSDSIPMHLLTKEAFDLYLKHLKKEGVLLVNITNRHVDLSDPLRIFAQEERWAALRLTSPSDGGVADSADWIMITRNLSLSQELLKAKRLFQWERTVPKKLFWTDDFSNLFEVLK